MLNASDKAPDIKVIDYEDKVVAYHMANGRMNTNEEQVLANIRSAIRRGHPQMRTGPLRPDRVCLVGSGPSLNDCEQELRDLIWDGAILVTMNGGYHWCRERGLQPKTQIVMDARPSNARFVQPYTPKCNYVLASQCAPETFDAVADYPNVWIFHPVIKNDGEASNILDNFYGGNWLGVGGGTTVVTRAIFLMRMSGYVRFNLFGVDCCWRDSQHHALPQPENDRDNYSTVRLGIDGVEPKEFKCAGWHVKQFEDLLTTLKINGEHFTIQVHGDGMLYHAMQMLGSASVDDLKLTKE